MTEKSDSQLSQSLAWLQLVVDQLPQTIFWKDLNSCFLGCDRSLAELAGAKSSEELIGKNDFEMPWREDAPSYVECDRRIIASKTAEYGILEKLIDADGELTWLETNKIPLLDSDNSVIGILGTFEDVTAKQLAKEKIKQSLRQLSDFQLALTRSAIVSIMDREGIIIYANDRFCEISQYSSAELLGNSHQIVSSGYHSEEFWQHLWTTISRGEIWQGEIYDRAKNGRGYWVNTTIIPSLDKNNQPIQYLEILQDISDRKKAEIALEYQLQKNELLNQLTQAIHQSMDTQSIFKTATAQIRQFLEVDSVGIFQLKVERFPSLSPTDSLRNVDRLLAWDSASSTSYIPNSRLQECCKAENRLLLNHLLSSLGFAIDEASNGRECIAKCSTCQPDSILMDIHMPVMNGIDATIAIKAQFPDLPIIALTASVFAESRFEVLEAGCDDFLSKPIKDTLLFDKIADYLPLTYIYESSEPPKVAAKNQRQRLVVYARTMARKSKCRCFPTQRAGFNGADCRNSRIS